MKVSRILTRKIFIYGMLFAALLGASAFFATPVIMQLVAAHRDSLEPKEVIAEPPPEDATHTEPLHNYYPPNE